MYFGWNLDTNFRDVAIDVRDPSNRVPQPIITPRSSKDWKIIESIVYCGLVALLASIIFTLIWCNTLYWTWCLFVEIHTQTLEI